MKAKKWNLIFLVFSMIFITYYLTREEGIAVLLKTLGAANPAWIGGALLMMPVYWGLEAKTLHLAVKAFYQQQAFSASLKTAMIGQFFNCVTPFSSGGQPMQAYYMVKSGVPLGNASCSLMVKFIVYQFVLTLYSGLTLLLRFEEFSAKVPGMGVLVLVGFGVNGLVILGLLCICFFGRQTDAFLRKVLGLLARMRIIKEEKKAIAHLQRELAGFYSGFQIMRQNFSLILQMGALTALQLTGYFLIPYCIFRSFHLEKVSVFSMVSAEAFVLNLSSFVPLPGAAGGAELSFHTMFGLFFPADLLNLSILLWRLITFYLPICVGLCFVINKGVGRSRRCYDATLDALH